MKTKIFFKFSVIIGEATQRLNKDYNCKITLPVVYHIIKKEINK